MVAFAAFVLSASFLPVRAQGADPPRVGSPRISAAAPGVAHPNSKPCTVQLFSGSVIADGAMKQFAYAPPAECAGPWSAVVLSGAFQISPGAPAQRLLRISIGGVNLYLGSAPSPSDSSGQSWSMERDLTDYSALLKIEHDGEAAMDSSEGISDPAEISGSLRLDFYRTDIANPAHRTADAILPLAAYAQISPDQSSVSRRFTLPRNIERAYLDTIAAGEGNDENWYLCAPKDAADRMADCAGDPYREMEVSIDGRPAGVAPVYPLLSADALDPLLWNPIPGVQSLGLSHCRVDLTPFAALLSDGSPHQISLGIYGVADRFVAAGSLLLYLDRGSARVSGGVTMDTLEAAPSLDTAEPAAPGTRTVTATRQFTIVGYINSSHGKIETRIDGKLRFTNEQHASAAGEGRLHQSAEFIATTSTRNGAVVLKLESRTLFPLRIEIADRAGAGGAASRSTSVHQGYESDETDSLNGVALFSSTLRQSASPADSQPAGSPASGASHGSQRYFYSNSAGACYSRTISAAAGLLTAVADGQGCTRSSQ